MYRRKNSCSETWRRSGVATASLNTRTSRLATSCHASLACLAMVPSTFLAIFSQLFSMIASRTWGRQLHWLQRYSMHRNEFAHDRIESYKLVGCRHCLVIIWPLQRSTSSALRSCVYLLGNVSDTINSEIVSQKISTRVTQWPEDIPNAPW